MSEHEIFYDSLDEDSYESPESSPPPSPDKDVSVIVPLYSGETLKDQITQTKKKIEKPSKPITYLQKPKKTYLSMYYEKKGRLEGRRNEEGSVTTRAMCDSLSPKRVLELESDLKEAKSTSHSDADSEEFYEKFMALEAENKKSSTVRSLEEKKEVKSKFSSCSSINFKQTGRPFHFKSTDNDILEKLELLKKRQSYGTKMSMKNRIQIEELKSLKKIKNSKLQH